MKHLADQVIERSRSINSVLLAGIDPVYEQIPDCYRCDTSGKPLSQPEAIAAFYTEALARLSTSLVATKPNLAFFEQYGIAGLRAYTTIRAVARSLNLPWIADAKRGDIGSTAEAYAQAFLGHAPTDHDHLGSDGLTVNPFLGFDTLEPFAKAAQKNNRLIFVLVKTSNPGSASFQSAAFNQAGTSVTDQLCDWIAATGTACLGESGYALIGAVVGATYPEELLEIRKRIPAALLLIPGYGAQGGKAESLRGAFDAEGQGALINVSRGLFANIRASERGAVLAELEQRVQRFVAELNAMRNT